MNKGLLQLIGLMVFLSGCGRSSTTVWEDTKSIGRYINRSGKKLWGNEAESKQIQSMDEFKGPVDEEFIPLQSDDIAEQTTEVTTAQPKTSPGSRGSHIPGISQFMNPSNELASIFTTLHFNTDDHVLRDKKGYVAIAKIAEYMKTHPTVHIFISGHCDERASEAYNLALGTRRSNSIRSLLVKRGVPSNRVYTISYGKEMPIDSGHTRSAWAKNRRVEFKLYDKRN